MREKRASRALAPTLLNLLITALAAGAPVAAQDTLGQLANECALGVPALWPRCLEAAVTLQAARGGIGLAASQGAAVPGSVSTLGRRMASSPRLAYSVRAGLARLGMPDPRDGSAPGRAMSSWVPSVEGEVTIGLVEGFSPLPTVGGVLSVDLLGTLTWALPPASLGFEGSAQGLGYGVRLGLVRESFTLPGVTVSVARRHLDEVSWGESANDWVSMRFSPTVTSVRATAGKDLLAFGILGGGGWERYQGSGRLSVWTEPDGVFRSDPSADGFASDRTLVFGGLSYTLLVLQLSAEGGFASGWDAVAGRASDGYDPSSGSFFGSLAARLTY